MRNKYNYFIDSNKKEDKKNIKGKKERLRKIMPEKSKILVEVKDMSKNFGVTIALSHVDFSVKTGEIRGLIGENGSGKSTVSSIIAGFQTASSGSMLYEGKDWKPETVLDAQEAGIGMIVQEAGTIPNISVAENIFLGNYKKFKKGFLIDKKAMIAEARKALDKIGVKDINPAHPAGMYDMQERKLIEVAKCMYHDPKLLIVDETTTALSQRGRDIIYKIMHDIADDGRAVMIISHDLNEMMEQCDTLTVLRDGVIIDNIAKENFDPDDIKQKMVGREIKGHYYRVDNDGFESEVVLKANYITTMKSILCLNMELHKKEILGIGGLSDCGMHTLGRALYGLEEVVDGQVVLTKEKTVIKNAQIAFKNGMGYVSKNRDTESLELNASIYSNIASTGYDKNNIGPFISSKKEKSYVDKQIKALRIKCQNAYQPVSALSGGNKQKVVFGKWCADDADVLILDCPTRGVDIGVKAAMYQLIYEMKQAGKSIIMISEELPELMGMCDRMLIMREGQISGEFYRNEYDDRKLIECMI